MSRICFIVLMGVAGSGKTTVGRLLAETLSWRFIDGDDFHSLDAIEKMKQGIGLSEEERKPWLERIAEALAECTDQRQKAVIACSALKRVHRQQLLATGSSGVVVFLKGDRALITDRINARSGHFFSPGLLDEQFALLEEPLGEESVTVDVARSPVEIVSVLLDRIDSSFFPGLSVSCSTGTSTSVKCNGMKRRS